MRRAAASSRARKAARCSGVASPPASRSRSYSASASGARGGQHGAHAVGALAADQRVGVLAGRQRGETQRAVGRQQRQCQFGRPRGGTAAGGVAVEAQDRRRREPPQLLELLLGQRRAERGHGAADAGLCRAITSM